MKLNTKTVVVPATSKEVVEDSQFLSTASFSVGIRAKISGDGVVLSFGHGSSPDSQLGNAKACREVARFLMLIADELDNRTESAGGCYF